MYNFLAYDMYFVIFVLQELYKINIMRYIIYVR